MTTWNLIGRNFTHTTRGHTGKAGTHGKYPKNLRWSFNFEGDVSFYLDQNILLKKDERRDLRKFGWVLESESIKPGTYQSVAKHKDELFEIYEAIFTHNQRLLNLDDRFKFTVCCGYWVMAEKIYPKNKLISAISSGKTMCDGHRWRNDFIEKNLSEFDLFGNKYHHIKVKEDGLADYMFSVTIENGSYSSYFTEKILDCFACGTIPIYRGAPDIGDFFNTDGIIFIDENFDFKNISEELYYSKMDAIKDNFNRVLSYSTAEDFIFNTYKYEFSLQ